MRYLLVLAFVTVALASDAVVFHDDELVTNRDAAIDNCIGHDMCIAHEAQMLADVIGAKGAKHSQCGIIWNRNNKPMRAVCDQRDHAGKCTQARIEECNPNAQLKWGYYCHKQEDHCTFSDTDQREIFALKDNDGNLRKFRGIGEAAAACEEKNGARLCFWHHVHTYVARYRLGTFSNDYYLTGIPHAVYQFDGRPQVPVVNWRTQATDEEYPALCVGRIYDEVDDPCEGDAPEGVYGAEKVSCVAPHGSNGPTNWILIQDRPLCSEEKFDFTEFAKSRPHYIRGFGKKGEGLWFGLDRLHELTNARDCRLRIEMWDNDRFKDNPKYIEYDMFKVHGQDFSEYAANVIRSCRFYRLEVSRSASRKHPGNLIDNFNEATQGPTDNNQFFSDMGHDCDAWTEGRCAEDETIGLNSAWWFGKCTNSNLNGRCDFQPTPNQPYNRKCKYWYNGSVDDGCLTKTRMMMKCHPDL